MRFDDVNVLVCGASFILIFAPNIIFPPYVVLTAHYVEVSRWTAAYGVLDENSTIYEFTFVSSPSEYDFQTSENPQSNPPGWFNLTIRIPFEIHKNWTRIHSRAIFSTGTYGGARYFWTLKWRFLNSSVVAFSDSWDHSLDVDPDRPTTLWRDNIEYHIGHDENNSSIYTPGQWRWEGYTHPSWIHTAAPRAKIPSLLQLASRSSSRNIITKTSNCIYHSLLFKSNSWNNNGYSLRISHS